MGNSLWIGLGNGLGIVLGNVSGIGSSNVLGNGLENGLGNGWRNGSGMVLGVVWGLVQGWFWKLFRNGLGIGLENPLRINSWCLNLHRFSLESLNSQIVAPFFMSFLLITIEWLK